MAGKNGSQGQTGGRHGGGDTAERGRVTGRLCGLGEQVGGRSSKSRQNGLWGKREQGARWADSGCGRGGGRASSHAGLGATRPPVALRASPVPLRRHGCVASRLPYLERSQCLREERSLAKPRRPLGRYSLWRQRRDPGMSGGGRHPH